VSTRFTARRSRASAYCSRAAGCGATQCLTCGAHRSLTPAEALNHVDELDGALAAYERAVELEPRNTRALYGLGIVLDRLNRPDDATQMYRRSREAAGR